MSGSLFFGDRGGATLPRSRRNWAKPSAPGRGVPLALEGIIRALATVLGAGIVALLPCGAARADDGSVGLALDAGLPEGMSGALAYRLTPRIRAHAGVGHNLVGGGVRAGAAVRFFTGPVTPTVAGEVGHFFRADAGWLARAVSEEDRDGELEQVGYDFASARLGLELGDDRAVFYVEVGASWIFGDLYFAELTDEGDRQVEVRSQSELDFVTLSGRAGVLMWF